VDNFKQRLEIPDSYPDQEGLSHLGGRSLNEFLEVERQAAALSLARAGRPNLTLHLPEVNPFTLGQLICLLEVVTLTAAHLFGVDPFDQSAASGLTDRREFDHHRQEIAAAPPPLEKYRIA
jgi:glucose-6-phosphate isomerase